MSRWQQLAIAGIAAAVICLMTAAGASAATVPESLPSGADAAAAASAVAAGNATAGEAQTAADDAYAILTESGVSSSAATSYVTSEFGVTPTQTVSSALEALPESGTEAGDVTGELLGVASDTGVISGGETAIGAALSGTCIETLGLTCAAAGGLALGAGIDYVLGDFSDGTSASTISSGTDTTGYGGNDIYTIAGVRRVFESTKCSGNQSYVTLGPPAAGGSGNFQAYAGCSFGGGGVYVEEFNFQYPANPAPGVNVGAAPSPNWLDVWEFDSPGSLCTSYGGNLLGPEVPGSQTIVDPSNTGYGQTPSFQLDNRTSSTTGPPLGNTLGEHGFTAYWFPITQQSAPYCDTGATVTPPSGETTAQAQGTQYEGFAIEGATSVKLSAPTHSCPSGATCTPVADASSSSWTLTPAELASELGSSLYAGLDQFLTAQAGGTTSSGTPVSDPGAVTIPNGCAAGASVTACEHALAAAGFTTPTVTTVTSAQEVVADGAGNVIQTQPAVGSSVDPSTVITIDANPQTLNVSVLTPSTTGETYAQYVARLQAEGYVGTATQVTASPENESPSVGPNDVVSVTPAPGTSIAPNAAVSVEVNPADAPAATTGTPPTSPSLPGINIPTASTPCSVFPFGVPCWIANQLGGFTAPAVAPDFQVATPAIFGGGTTDVNLGNIFGLDLSSVMAVARPVLLALSFMSIVVWLAGMAMGGSTGGGGDGGDE